MNGARARACASYNLEIRAAATFIESNECRRLARLDEEQKKIFRCVDSRRAILSWRQLKTIKCRYRRCQLACARAHINAAVACNTNSRWRRQRWRRSASSTSVAAVVATDSCTCRAPLAARRAPLAACRARAYALSVAFFFSHDNCSGARTRKNFAITLRSAKMLPLGVARMPSISTARVTKYLSARIFYKMPERQNKIFARL